MTHALKLFASEYHKKINLQRYLMVGEFTSSLIFADWNNTPHPMAYFVLEIWYDF